MGGFANFGGKLGKTIKKIDPLRGGDKILEGAGLPTFTGEGDKNILNMMTPATPEMPKIPEAKVMPTADDAELEKARRRSLTRQRQSQGRASTILTDNTETLG